ncbi:DUF3429 domain-containing protein [Marinobacter psychrophilus]|uniref:DUF3429 domain-containing protein n=1 Tax=Marinobacter psychrophilus TaxID=330734 RepID=UPI001B71DB01|nr:DUF3429 domain-containing protein [Marinobacter psychrophilus]MBQ0762205.1 DUF3429 domain-containing protein [Marinobacter psychrophilus]MBQ0843779.1 DUF3429 domain-containing protein [Marinobacter psychrophilus]
MIAVARLAIFVGLAGLIPFIGAIVALFLMPHHSIVVSNWFYTYSAGILAFMAGVYWTIALQREDRCYPMSPLVSMLFSQIFFIAAGVGLLVTSPWKAVLFTVAFLGLYLVDARWMKIYWPAWYLRLRLGLTLTVVVCQVIVATWFFAVHYG